jgi:putative acetyltransferase
MDIWIRPFRPEYLDAIVAVNDAAFGGPDEGRITRALHADSDSVLSLVASGNTEIAAHIEFFRIRIDGAPVGVGLGPMSVLPEYQKTGIGGRLIRFGLTALQGAGETLVFVLGHDTYYPKFGFTEAAAKPFSAPWSGPHFMALRLAPGGPETGTLIYPKAFGG